MNKLEAHQVSPEFLKRNDPENWNGWVHQADMAQKAIDAGYLEVAEKRLRELYTDAWRDLAAMPELRLVVEEVSRMEEEVDAIEVEVPFRGALHGYRKGMLR